MKNIIIGTLAVSLIAVIGFFVITAEDGSNANAVQEVASSSPSQVATEEKRQLADENYFNEEELVEATKTYLKVLQRMNYANFDNSKDADNVSGLIVSMTAEAMKDKNDLNNLIYQASTIKDSKILGVDVTGQVLEMALMQLVIAHDDLIQFLRTVDPINTDLSEFQYQMAQFQSATKSAYMSLAENTAIFPYTFLDLSEEEGVPATWRISDASRAELLAEIDLLFGDIFIQDDIQYEETQTRDTTVYMVRSLQEFLETEL